LIDLFDDEPKTAHEINATVMALKKALIERALSGEMNHHLGDPPGAAKPQAGSNQHNGTGAKTVYTGEGPLRLDIPRECESSFEPLLIPKHERRFTGFDEKIIAMYARGMTVCEIREFLLEHYGTHVLPEFVSSVTDEAATKLSWLALRNITKKWSRRAHDWKTAMNQFAILFAERFVQTSCDYSTRPEHEIPDRP